MKKLMAYAFVLSLVVASCNKKEAEVESNVMLPEPNVEVSDSVAKKPVANAVSAVDSTSMKKDSAK